MSDSNDNEERPLDDRLDVLLSAERDGVLYPSERAELEALVASDPVAGERRAAFAAIDEALVALGQAPLDDSAIAEGLASVRARTTGAAGAVVPVEVPRAPWRHPAVPLFAAAAAAVLMIVFALAPTERNEEIVPSDEPGLASEAPMEPVLEDEDFDAELAIALGYGEGGDFIPGVDNEDLSVISELDLLDFMAAREEGGRG